MSCVCSVKRLVGIRRMATSVSVACERLYLSHSLGITTRTLRCRRLSFEKCSNVSTSSQSPFDPDVHLVPSEANNAAHISPHHRAPTASTVSSIWQNVPIVYTTGISYKDNDGVSSTASIGVYWGDDDVLNRSKVLGEGSTILAEIEAVTLALKKAIYELNLPRVIVRTDSEYVCRCIAKYFNFWKQSDFCKASGDKVKYADELQELDRLLSMIEAKVEFVPKNKPDVGNWVFHKLKQKPAFGVGWLVQPTSSLSAGDTSVDPDSSAVAYTCGVFRDTDLRGEPFTRAGLGVHWLGKPENNVSRRLSMFPVTLFRSQLQAIIAALEQAVEGKYTSVIVRTDSRTFLKYFRREWRKADGGLVRNYPQYLRIIDLACRLKYAGERCEAQEEAFILAEDGMSQPMVSEAKRLLRRGVSDPSGSTIHSWKVVVDSNEGDWTGSNKQAIFSVDRVCLLSEIDAEKKRGMYCVFWDGDSNHVSTTGWVQNVKLPGYLALQKALVLALEQASESGRKRMIVRMGAVRLLKTVIEWIPQWRRNQWTNSLRKPIANADHWKHLDELMQDIEIKWEYSDSTEVNDELKAVDARAKEYLQKNFANKGS
uniref:ribonuclease H n=1 Tax=Ascaris lumbricoides TaxID=6252 RepID=A0A9J2PKF6_ASCLU